MMPVLWIGARAVVHVETSREETLKKVVLQMPGKGSSVGQVMALSPEPSLLNVGWPFSRIVWRTS